VETDKIFPNNWKEIVQGKKVIFYNTSVGNILSGRKKHIEKMQWVFSVFNEHPEVVLWWRPHPLELSTIQSMLPELEEQYKEIRRQYQEKNVGILDESTDLNRAIAVSDAYYGDWSSVVQLVTVVGKPVLYENDNILEWHKDLFFNVVDFVCINQIVWFLSSTMNILFAMNLDTFELVETIKIPYGNTLGKYMSYRIANIENYLVLIPGCGKWIIRFDLKEHKFEQLEIGNYGVSIKFGAYFVWNEFIYMLPGFESRIIKYDVFHNKIVCEKQFEDILFLDTNIDVVGSNIYAVEVGKNYIFKYDIQNDLCEKIQVSVEDIQLFAVKKIKDLFILIIANKNEILLWNERENKVWKLDGLPKEYSVKDRPFCDFVEYKQDIYFFPEQSDRVFKFNKDRMVLEQYQEIATKKEDEIYFSRAKNIGNKILAFNCWNNQWLIVDPQENTVNRYDIILDQKRQDEITKYSIFDTDEKSDKHRKVWEEDKDFYSLHNYIKDISRIKTTEQKMEKKESIGERIHKLITSDIIVT